MVMSEPIQNSRMGEASPCSPSALICELPEGYSFGSLKAGRQSAPVNFCVDANYSARSLSHTQRSGETCNSQRIDISRCLAEMQDHLMQTDSAAVDLAREMLTLSEQVEAVALHSRGLEERLAVLETKVSGTHSQQSLKPQQSDFDCQDSLAASHTSLLQLRRRLLDIRSSLLNYSLPQSFTSSDDQEATGIKALPSLNDDCRSAAGGITPSFQRSLQGSFPMIPTEVFGLAYERASDALREVGAEILESTVRDHASSLKDLVASLQKDFTNEVEKAKQALKALNEESTCSTSSDLKPDRHRGHIWPSTKEKDVDIQVVFDRLRQLEQQFDRLQDEKEHLIVPGKTKRQHRLFSALAFCRTN